MKITILQTDIKWGHIEKNIAAAERMMASAQVSDLYVLPEMWATGFMTESADKACSYVPVEWMRRTAGGHGCAICGGVAVKDDGGLYRNRQYFVKPDGSYKFYDKRHLFAYGGEYTAYTAGNQRTVVEYGGIRFLLLTCYDLRFPVWSRNRGDYDAMIYVANWPESRQEAWQILLRARAIENQCYVIAANRTGNDPKCGYAGGSAIINAKGVTAAQAENAEPQSITADIDMESLMSFRRKFPVLEDRDTFKIINQEQ